MTTEKDKKPRRNLAKAKNYKIHDFAFKIFISDLNNVKELAQNYLDKETLDILDLDRIEPIDLKELSISSVERTIMDSCFKIFAKNSKKYAILIIEHQSSHDNTMFLRQLNPIISMLKKQAESIRSELLMIIPATFIFYKHNKDLKIHGLASFFSPEHLELAKRHLLNHKIVTPWAMSDSKLFELKYIGFAMFTFKYLHEENFLNKIIESIQKFSKTQMSGQTARNIVQYIQVLLYSFGNEEEQKVFERAIDSYALTDQHFEQFNRKQFNEGMKKGKEEGMRKGKKEGIKEATINLSKKLVRSGISVEEVSRITEISKEDIMS